MWVLRKVPILGSLSARRAWIEICPGIIWSTAFAWSLSARRAWIEIANFCRNRFCPTSLSARRAWIEIPAGCWRDARRVVALRKESVDRNEGVIATKEYNPWSLSARRAWIEIHLSTI